MCHLLSQTNLVTSCSHQRPVAPKRTIICECHRQTSHQRKQIRLAACNHAKTIIHVRVFYLTENPLTIIFYQTRISQFYKHLQLVMTTCCQIINQCIVLCVYLKKKTRIYTLGTYSYTLCNMISRRAIANTRTPGYGVSRLLLAHICNIKYTSHL